MKNLIKTILNELFIVGLIGLLFFVAMELIWPNIVQAYINISLYLFIWLIIGIINVILIKQDGK